MKKYNEPQIYIVNNEEIAERLSKNYSIATGDLGIIKTAIYEKYEDTRYVELEYNLIDNLHEYSVVVIDLQNENETKLCCENDNPDGKPYLFELKYP